MFSVRSPSRKRELRDEDKLLREQIGELLEQHGWGNETAQQLAHWNPYDQNANADFFNLEWMFGETGFDIVIGNPPYIQIQKLKNSAILAKQDFQVFDKGSDLYILFFEKGWLLLKNNGVLSFITPNTWLQSISFTKIRKFLSNQFLWSNILIPDKNLRCSRRYISSCF